MPPSALAPLDAHKARALTTIYAPRKLKTRTNKTAQSRMMEDVRVKPSLSPFHPLPAIGQTLERSNTKVIVFELNDHEPAKVPDALQPLTPLRLHGVRRARESDIRRARESDIRRGRESDIRRARESDVRWDREPDSRRPQPLLRENTYDVIEPTRLGAAGPPARPKVSPRSRFKEAAKQVVQLSSTAETGKLLCLRERHTLAPPAVAAVAATAATAAGDGCRLARLPRCADHQLNKLSEIFQNLETQGRYTRRDKMRKENSWF